MQFNLYISTGLGTYNILDIDDSELEKVVKCYKHGRESVFLKGKRHIFKNLFEIQIFTFESEKVKTREELYKLCSEQNLLTYAFMGTSEWIPIEVLERFGKIVTDNYIKDDFGYLEDEKVGTQ